MNVLRMMAGSPPGLANVCGAPGGTMTRERAGASEDFSPLVNRTVPETT